MLKFWKGSCEIINEKGEVRAKSSWKTAAIYLDSHWERCLLDDDPPSNMPRLMRIPYAT